MAIGTTAAILGGAAIAGSVYGANKAAKAANRSADMQAEANRESIAFQRETRDQIRQDNAVRQQVGDASMLQLAGIMGVPVTGRSVSNPMLPSGAASGATGGRVIDMVQQPDGSWAASGGAGQPDYAAYFRGNPDLGADPSLMAFNPGDLTGDGKVDDADRGAWHYQTYGQGEGRALPGAAPAADPNAPAATPWVDPTAPGGYMIGARPEAGPRPAGYSDARSRPTLDLSIDRFRASPDYEFRVREMEKGLGNLMSARGGVFSGQRMKAALARRNDLADAEFNDWAGREIGIYGMNLGQYNADRAFDYGQNRDTVRDYEVDRSRSDGLYDDDRRHITGRYDQRNSTLLNLAGFGTQAANSNASAATTFANNAGALMTDTARARGDAAVAGANAWNQALGGLMTTGAYLAGSGAFGGSGASLPKTYSI